MGRISVLLAACFLGLLGPRQAGAADLPVDLELVLAIDISGSIDTDEAKLQRQGYVDALRDPEIHKAIKAGVIGRIAITYFEWSSFDHKSIVAGWAQQPTRFIGMMAFWPRPPPCMNRIL